MASRMSLHVSTSSNSEGVHAVNLTLATESNINDDPSLVHLTKAVEAGFSLADTKIRNIEKKFNVKISDVLYDLNELKARSEPVSERLVNVLLEENTKLKKDNDVLPNISIIRCLLYRILTPVLRTLKTRNLV